LTVTVDADLHNVRAGHSIQWQARIADDIGFTTNVSTNAPKSTLNPTDTDVFTGRLAGGIAGLQDALKYGASSLNPLIRAPLEIGAGKEFFSDRTIAPTSDGGDISIPQYTLNQIRPIRELQKMGQIGREQGGFGNR
jgi:hypothetical protein